MARKQNKAMTGLLAAVGAVSAFFGARALVNRLRSRQAGQLYGYMEEDDLVIDEIPITGMPEPNFPPAEPHPQVHEPDMPEAGVATTGQTEMGKNYQSSFQDEQPPIPDTGLGAPVMDQERARDSARDSARDTIHDTTPFDENEDELDRERDIVPAQEPPRAQPRQANPLRDMEQADMGQVSSADQSIPVGSLVGPLVVHLLSFHNMINLLQHYKETNADSGQHMPDVREGGADAVSSLKAQLQEFDTTSLASNSLQARMVQIMDQIRDALQNKDYSEDQLMEISDKLRPAVCKVLEMIQEINQDDVTGFEDVQKAYECI